MLSLPRQLFGLLTLLALASTLTEAKAVRIMPLGDSITLGDGGAGGFGGYRRTLYFLLTGAGYSLDYLGTATDNSGSIPDRNHEGHGGWTIDQIHGNVTGFLNAVGNPDIVLLHIGTNDFLRGVDTVNAIRRLDELVETITTLRPETHVIVANLIKLQEPQNTSLNTRYNPFIKEVVDRYIAEGKFVSFVDMNSAVSPGFIPDGIHPNQTGYDQMAIAWFDAIEKVAEPEDTEPPAIVEAVGTAARDEVVITFNRRLDKSTAEDVANYIIDQDLTVHSATLSNYSRVVTLKTDPQTLGTAYNIEINNLIDTVSPTPNSIEANSNVTFFPPTPSGYFNGVEESKSYTLVQSLEIPTNSDFSQGLVPYEIDFRDQVGAFDRVAYYLELQSPGGDLQFAWASMDAFTNDISQLSVPTIDRQLNVENLNVVSNAPGLVAGVDLSGEIVFLPGNYGSMQIRDTSQDQNIIAFNRWGGIGGNADIGIGNRSTGTPDWIGAQNASSYELKKLQVLVRTCSDTVPPVLMSAAADYSRTQITVTFDEPVRPETLIAENFDLDQVVTVLSVDFDDDFHLATLTTTPHPAAPLTLTVNNVRDTSQNANLIAPNSIVTVTTPSLPNEILGNIGASADGYELVYSLDIPTTGNFNTASPYLIDNSQFGGSFSRIAYYVELQKPNGEREFLWTAMDRFTSAKGKIGIPTFASGASFQQSIDNLEVLSNSAAVTTGTWPTGGHIEFWPRDYGPENSLNIDGASSIDYDLGDSPLATGGYGSMQIHNVAESQTLFAMNRWGIDGRTLELGIGNQPEDFPDWTDAKNAADYSYRRLHILILPESTPAVPEQVLANVPESAEYELVYSLDIPARGNLSGGAGFSDYTVDRSAETLPFSRIAYYIELQKASDEEPTFAWVSMDAFTIERSKIGIPNTSAGVGFQQFVTNLTVISNSGIAQGSGINGNLEFWPSGYLPGNLISVPGADGAVYDFGDTPAAGDYGSMQIHNHEAGETIFALNHWGTTGSTTNPLCVGIGNNPDPVDGATDYTFADNAGDFQLRRLHVFVLPGSSPIGAPEFTDIYASAAGDRVLISFDRELSDSSASPANFEIDGDLAVTEARLMPGNRQIALTTTPQIPGTTYNISGRGRISTREGPGTSLRPGSSIQFTAYTAPSALSHVPDDGYDLIYELDIPSQSPRWNVNAIPYSIDETQFGERLFDRVAYLLQLDDEWIYVSFDAHTDEINQIGVPTTTAMPTPFEGLVTNMNIASNVSSIITGNGIATGNIEFWGGGYEAVRGVDIPNASNSEFDFGDRMTTGGYGSMQIHNHGAEQTLLAFNDWGSRSNDITEMGIGNSDAPGAPDWSLANNAGDYATRKLFVLARSGGTPSGARPEILSHPCDHLALAGEPHTFSVTPLSEGAFTYQWRHNGIAILGATRPWLEIDSVGESTLGEYDVIVTGSNFASTTSIPATLGLAELPPTSYELWQIANNLSEEISDHDTDGLSDLLEFAFGSDPNSSLQTNSPRLNLGEPTAAEFSRRKDFGQSGSVSYTVQFSSDLRTFFDSEGELETVLSEDDASDYELIRLPFPATLENGEEVRYFRVKVELVP